MMEEASAEQRSSQIVSFLLCQTAAFGAGFIGSQASIKGLEAWYPSLSKPAFTPPGWVFAPVWSFLYFLMGVALWQVWRSPASKARTWGLVLFGVQLVLNALWSWIFFAWNKLPIAFWEIVVLDLAILGVIILFNKVKSSAAWLLVPYIVWCSFATLLTFSIWRMNPVNATPQDGDVQIKVGEPEIGPGPIIGNP